MVGTADSLPEVAFRVNELMQCPLEVMGRSLFLTRALVEQTLTHHCIPKTDPTGSNFGKDLLEEVVGKRACITDNPTKLSKMFFKHLR